MKKATRRVAFFFLHCSYKPGSVSPHAGMMSVIYLLHESPHGSSVLPSIVVLGRAALRRWYTRTCSPQPAQPSDHPLTGGLLHHLLTLTSPPLFPPTRGRIRGARRLFSSAVTYCHQYLLLSEVRRPMLPGLSSRAVRHQRQTETVLSGCKSTKKSRSDQTEREKMGG